MSCARRLSADRKQGIVEMKINDLPSEFLLTDSQKERLTTLPQYIVENHIQVVNLSFLSLEKHFVDGQSSIPHFKVVAIHG